MSLGNEASKVPGSSSSRHPEDVLLGLASPSEASCGSVPQQQWSLVLSAPAGWEVLAQFWGCPPGVGRVVQPPSCFLLQMADCGGLPQVVQVRYASRLPRGMSCVEPLALLTLTPHFLFPQPGKLTEAFKYFVQGMGYSKWQTKFSGLERGCCEGNSAFLVHLSPLASVSPPVS